MQAANGFVLAYSGLWGVTPNQLVPVGPFPGGQHTTPLMYDKDTGTYRFTGVHFTQEVAGIPVFRARLTLLVRNEPGSPLVLVSADLRDLGAFEIPQRQGGIDENRVAQDAIARRGAIAEVLTSRYVIFAGVDEQPAPPVLGIEYVTESSDPTGYEKWLYIIDDRTGALLYAEDQILEADVTGNVSALASDGIGASICNSLSIQPLPYARIAIGPTVAFADVNGDYTIDGGAGGLVTVESSIHGQYFQVFNLIEPDSGLTQDATPPAIIDFLYDVFTATTPEFVQAEIEAYIHANSVRDFVLSVNPAYPVIGGQTEWPVNVNINNTCNAFYDGASINFFISGGGCNNSAIDSVVYHEYGHHLVNVGGSGQRQYGEGMSDCVALLITDDPVLGRGFRTCGNGIRNADNNFQYPCLGEIHFCGNLISGCVWDLRNELASTEPVNFRDILANLTLNSILLHTGSGITPQITIDFLTLDDDNANLFDGTPHYTEIMNAFLAHNMNPELPLLAFAFPDGLPDLMHPATGTTIRVEVLADNGTPVPGTGMLHYDDGNGITSVLMTVVSPNIYDAVLPPADCGDIVSYTFSAETDLPYVQEFPPPSLGVLTVRAVINVTDIFVDDFEIDTGWSVVDDLALTDGTWNRGVPLGGGDRADPPADADGSGQCFLTDNVDGNSDVDGGTTTLTSPVLDASAANTVGYWRWYSNSAGAGALQDVFIVEVSDNGGADWQSLEQVGPGGAEVSGGWFYVEHNLLSLPGFTTNDQFMIRFIASDTDPQSLVEAAIDGVTLLSISCCPVSPADLNEDGFVNVIDLLALLAAWGPCQPFDPCWQDASCDGVVNVTDLLLVLGNWG